MRLRVIEFVELRTKDDPDSEAADALGPSTLVRTWDQATDVESPAQQLSNGFVFVKVDVGGLTGWIEEGKLKIDTPEPLSEAGFVLQCLRIETVLNDLPTIEPWFTSADFIIARALVETRMQNVHAPAVGADGVGPLRVTQAEWQTFLSAIGTERGYRARDLDFWVFQPWAALYRMHTDGKALSEAIDRARKNASRDGLSPFQASSVDLSLLRLLGTTDGVEVIVARDTGRGTDSLGSVFSQPSAVRDAVIGANPDIFAGGSAPIDTVYANIEKQMDEALANAAKLIARHSPESIIVAGDVGDTDGPAPGNVVTPAPGNVVTPAPGNVVTPAPGNVVVTPAPGNVVVTPAPGNVVTPAPGNTQPLAPDNKPIPVPDNLDWSGAKRSLPTRTEKILALYAAFRQAGFSDAGSRALIAEVGRENSLDPALMFGGHLDPANGALNGGFFSWQGSRGVALQRKLKAGSLIDAKGKMVRTQAALNAQAAFAKSELSASYPKIELYLTDPNINFNYDKAAQLIGRYYLKWRFDDPLYSRGHQNRRDFLEYTHQALRQRIPNSATVGAVQKLKIEKSADGFHQCAGLTYDLSGKIRRRPISENCVRKIMTAAAQTDTSLRVIITSAGQDPVGFGTKRTGSTRHDVKRSTLEGETADLVLVHASKIVTPPDDMTLYERFLENAAAQGFSGIGHYGWGVHVGDGAKAAWGPTRSGASLNAKLGKAIRRGWSRARI